MFFSEDEWVNHFSNMGAFWHHDGNPRRPHALLTKGGHSNGFFDGNLVVEFPALLNRVASDLVEKARATPGVDISGTKRVVGPAMGAIKLAQNLARHIGKDCLAGFCQEITPPTSDAVVGWKLDQFQVKEGELIAACEGMITNGGSVGGMIPDLEAHGAQIAPVIFAIVNRSGKKEIGGRQIVALIDQPMEDWQPDRCSLCTKGSIAIRPKEGDNWSLLTAEYN